ncbi:MAG: LamG-like jellyroll fold domain-containing protein [Verrucomicrobiota bacterium]
MSIAIALGLAVSSSADIMVDLDATGLPEGPLETWSNTGYLGEDFIAEVDIPSVTTIDGVKGVTLDGENDWYVGPSAIYLAGSADRTIEAWIYNPEMADEETIFAWGRRGGPDASNLAFNHGVNEVFGAVGHWGGTDIGWAGNYATGRWTYVAYTYDSWMTTSTVYFDGEYANSEPVGLLVTHDFDENYEVELPFVVGAQNQQNGTRHPELTGSMTIARIRVHDYALSEAEISACVWSPAIRNCCSDCGN